MYTKSSVCQILHLEEYALYVSSHFKMVVLGLCFLCLLTNSPHFPFFIGLHIHITSQMVYFMYVDLSSFLFPTLHPELVILSSPGCISLMASSRPLTKCL